MAANVALEIDWGARVSTPTHGVGWRDSWARLGPDDWGVSCPPWGEDTWRPYDGWECTAPAEFDLAAGARAPRPSTLS